jgi:Rrf2 family protein
MHMRNSSTTTAMMLSVTAEYALRALLVLASEPRGTALHADNIADAIGAPHNYLAKTMNTLVKAGIVTSARGPRGGFILATEPSALLVTRVAEVFDEPRLHATCLLGCNPCDAAHPCAAHARWSTALRVARGAFATISIADLLGADAA